MLALTEIDSLVLAEAEALALIDVLVLNDAAALALAEVLFAERCGSAGADGKELALAHRGRLARTQRR